MIKSIRFFSAVLLLLLLPVGIFLAAKGVGHPSAQSNSITWVPYSAHYTERVSKRDASGIQTEDQTLSEEVRAEDGSLLTVTKVDGVAISGKLWQASGQEFSLDYAKKRAILSGNSPRRHPFVPPDPPLGTKMVAGISCVIYPVTMKDGGVSICVNMHDDIPALVEVHSDSGGLHQDYVKELTWIDLTSPVDPSVFKVPDGFTTLLPSSSKQ